VEEEERGGEEGEERRGRVGGAEKREKVRKFWLVEINISAILR